MFVLTPEMQGIGRALTSNDRQTGAACVDLISFELHEFQVIHWHK